MIWVYRLLAYGSITAVWGSLLGWWHLPTVDSERLSAMPALFLGLVCLAYVDIERLKREVRRGR